MCVYMFYVHVCCIIRCSPADPQGSNNTLRGRWVHLIVLSGCKENLCTLCGERSEAIFLYYITLIVLLYAWLSCMHISFWVWPAIVFIPAENYFAATPHPLVINELDCLMKHWFCLAKHVKQHQWQITKMQQGDSLFLSCLWQFTSGKLKLLGYWEWHGSPGLYTMFCIVTIWILVQIVINLVAYATKCLCSATKKHWHTCDWESSWEFERPDIRRFVQCLHIKYGRGSQTRFWGPFGHVG